MVAIARSPEAIVLTARRNCAMAPAALCAAFAGMASVSLGIAMVWAWSGAWMVLPFAGIEVAALGTALVFHARQLSDFERITLGRGCLVVEVSEKSRLHRYELNPCWARLTVGDSIRGHRLALRSHGREIELGRFLPEDERRQLADELRRELAPRAA